MFDMKEAVKFRVLISQFLGIPQHRVDELTDQVLEIVKETKNPKEAFSKLCRGWSKSEREAFLQGYIISSATQNKE